jgi:putative (di)nucleoside polyphosphate hydrolase
VTDKETLPYRPCVGIMLLNRQGLAFVGQRADRSDAPEGVGQWWQMPQGGVDEGEQPEQAARRELFEETGVRSINVIARTKDWLVYDLPQHLIGVAWEGRYRGQKQMWFAARFEGPESEIDITRREDREQEFDTWQWVRVAELPSLVVPFKRVVYERVVEEFAPLLKG